MSNMTVGQATLAGGCFWCLEAVFQELRGVVAVRSGYCGGQVENPGYREVCSGQTGHAEAVQITFDPDEITFQELLLVFFSVHDPTTLNRQGADVGTQYRSAIFWHDDEQKAVAEALIQQLQNEGVFRSPIVTEVSPIGRFYPAEAYHQNYYRNNRSQPYCMAVINPKLSKLRKLYADKLKTLPISG